MKIITLLENTSLQPELTSKQGLSLYIETSHKKILFDTGPDQTFIENAKKLKIDLSTIDLVFLSHGHYDHGGGIPAFQKLNKTARGKRWLMIFPMKSPCSFVKKTPTSCSPVAPIPVWAIWSKVFSTGPAWIGSTWSWADSIYLIRSTEKPNPRNVSSSLSQNLPPILTQNFTPDIAPGKKPLAI